MRMHVKERVRESVLHNARPPAATTHVQHVTESRKTPQSKVYAS